MTTDMQYTIGMMAATILAFGNRNPSSGVDIRAAVRSAFGILDAIEDEERSRQAVREWQAQRAEALPVGHATTDYEPFSQ